MTDIAREDPQIVALAQAIEGPWFDQHLGWDKLIMLRQHKWKRLSLAERSIRMQQARAVLKTQMHNAIACQVPPTLEDRG